VLYRIKQFPHNMIFFLLCTAYIGLVIEPHLIYNCFGNILSDAPIFVTGWRFLENSLTLPGGFVVYISGLLSQGLYYNWVGTLIIILSALFLCELYRRHLLTAGFPRATVLASVPAVLLFLIYSRYKHPLPACLTVSLGLLFSLVFQRLPLRSSVVRSAVLLPMAAVAFWLTGTGGLSVFLIMTVIYGIFIHRDFVLTLLALTAGFAIIWGLARYLFLIPPKQAFLVLTPLSNVATTGMKTFSMILTIILYGFVPLSILLLFIGEKIFCRIGQRRKMRSKQTMRKKPHAVKKHKKLLFNVLRKSAVLALPVVLMAAGLYLTYDRMGKTLLLANDYSLHKKWEKILELSDTLPKGKSNVYFNHDLIRALYHTGRLPYDLFKFPQTPHGLFLTHEKRVSYLTQLKLCDLYLELGQVNMAEKLASEILATKNHSPVAVEKLAWINIIKSAGLPAAGKNRTARIYLNALKKDLIYRATAENLLRNLDNGFAPQQKAYVNRLRSYMLEEGNPGTGKDSIEQMLTALLVRNPRNKMAFEYLMTYYLMSGQVDRIAANTQRLDALGYQNIPLLYEEAILIYLGSRGRQIDLSKFNIRPQTIQRYRNFIQLRKDMQTQNPKAVLNRLILEFGSSYFFYFTFGQVGLL
jgi:hypothetical protein